MNIYTYGYKTLTEKSENLKDEEINEELFKFLDKMVDTMRKANGCGLAANQVGIEKRFFVLETNSVVRKVINPEILEYSDEKEVFEEGCLSIPGIYKNVVRPKKIKVRYVNEKKEIIEEVLDEMDARAFQHEYDHIEGILFTDLISPVAKNLIRKKLEKMKKIKLVREFE